MNTWVSQRTVLVISLMMVAAGGSGPAEARAGVSAPVYRHAVLLDFTTTAAIMKHGVSRSANVAEAMDSEVNADPVPDDFARPASAVSWAADRVRVPSWMLPTYGGAGTPAMVPVDGCGGAYRPSTLLRPVAEARRRLIYPLVVEAACAAGLPVGLMDALIIQESRYDPLAISPKGAVGLAQLMTGTARTLGANPYDIRGNLAGGARYLRQQLDAFGAPHLALAAYNAGPARVRRAGGIPAIAETRTYVERVLLNWRSVTPGSARSAPHIGPAVSKPVRHVALLAY